MKDSKQRVLKNGFYLLLILLFLALWIVKCFSNGFLFGYRTTFVMSGSMKPEIPVASLLVEKEFDKNGSVLKGDIITFLVKHDGGKKRVTHRVVSISEDGMETKGDANPKADAWKVFPEDVEGKVVFVVPNVIQVVAGVVVLGIILKHTKNLIKRECTS